MQRGPKRDGMLPPNSSGVSGFILHSYNPDVRAVEDVMSVGDPTRKTMPSLSGASTRRVSLTHQDWESSIKCQEKQATEKLGLARASPSPRAERQ